MNRELFGTDGIRGVAGEWPLDDAGAEQVGRAVGMHFTEPGESVTLGRDTRLSSPELAEALARGITAVGANVEYIDVVPTPGLSYSTLQSDAKAAVMVTASHNPAPDNGFKVFGADGQKLPDSTEVTLNELINNELPNRGLPGKVIPMERRVNDYRRFLVGEDALHGHQRYALDMANGATSFVAGRAFRMLGAKVGEFFNEPNGENINDRCGATDTKYLRDIVYSGHFDGGFAFDGDGDRLIAVDETGYELNGDHIMYILAKHLGYKQVVATQMSNMGLERALKQDGIELHRTDVGDRYVLEGMRQTGASLGGEQSGHIILAERLCTGDGILAAIQLAKAVDESGKSLKQWREELQLFPQSIVNIDTPHKALVHSPQVQELIARQTELLGDDGRVNVRASGTQSQIRVMVESPDAEERAPVIASQVQDLIPRIA